MVPPPPRRLEIGPRGATALMRARRVGTPSRRRVVSSSARPRCRSRRGRWRSCGGTLSAWPSPRGRGDPGGCRRSAKERQLPASRLLQRFGARLRPAEHGGDRRARNPATPMAANATSSSSKRGTLESPDVGTGHYQLTPSCWASRRRTSSASTRVASRFTRAAARAALFVSPWRIDVAASVSDWSCPSLVPSAA